MPGRYRGASVWRKMVVAKIPPIPPKDTTSAVVTARFVWETTLLEAYELGWSKFCLCEEINRELHMPVSLECSHYSPRYWRRCLKRRRCRDWDTGRQYHEPAYRHPAVGANPVRHNPIRVRTVCIVMNKARWRYLSEIQAKNMTLIACKKGPPSSD